MSYTITQQPDTNNLSSMCNDIIINSTAPVVFEFLQASTSILLETYTPDASGNIYIRELGRIVDLYLAGSIENGVKTTIMLPFTVKLDGTTVGTYNFLKCRAYTNISSSSFFAGSIFLNLLKPTKTTTRTAKEYVTVRTVADLSVFLTYWNGSSFVNTDEVILDNSHNAEWKTFDVSFETISALFPAIEKSTIVAIRVKVQARIHVLLIDRANYLVPLNFLFKNSFDVPETIVTRGDVQRKGETTFDTAKVNRIEQKYNVERVDSFDVNSGKIYSLNDYDRYREMFNSEDVRIYFVGAWRKVIVTEESSTVSLRAGNLQPISFNFRFADVTDNRIVTGEAFARWILEYGVYEDDKVWIDEGQWNDVAP